MNNGERVYWKYYKNYTQKKNRLQIYSYFVTRFTDQRGFSGLETKKGKVKNHIPLRINFLFFFIFVLFSAFKCSAFELVQSPGGRLSQHGSKNRCDADSLSGPAKIGNSMIKL